MGKMTSAVRKRTYRVRERVAAGEPLSRIANEYKINTSALITAEERLADEELAMELRWMQVAELPKVPHKMTQECPHVVRRSGGWQARCGGCLTRCRCLQEQHGAGRLPIPIQEVYE
ncbi:MAG: hypothetical protein QNI84_08075 [Henriciella sp.]|nr:hypothetical protein [Henriciella sp.]